MRKVLNVLQVSRKVKVVSSHYIYPTTNFSLQACFTAYEKIDEKEIYECIGKPLPEDIKRVIQWLMSEEPKSSYHSIRKLQKDRGIALADIVKDVSDVLLDYELPLNMRLLLLESLSDLECVEPLIFLLCIYFCLFVGGICLLDQTKLYSSPHWLVVFLHPGIQCEGVSARKILTVCSFSFFHWRTLPNAGTGKTSIPFEGLLEWHVFG